MGAAAETPVLAREAFTGFTPASHCFPWPGRAWPLLDVVVLDGVAE